MKIGLVFGSFNPIHIGHILIGEKSLDYVDHVIYIVSPQSPYKVGDDIVDYDHRYNMVKLCTDKNERFSVSNIEENLPKPTRTYMTMLELEKVYPNDEFFIILGSDNVNTIHQWLRYDDVLHKYPIIGYIRDGVSFNKEVDIEIESDIKISSSMIRKDIDLYSEYVDKSVIEYIKSNDLY